MLLTEGQALLRGILENPADDLSRLVFADWLEETGQDERGEFIRVQVELAGVNAEVAALGKCECVFDPTIPCTRCRTGRRPGLWDRRERLCQRQHELLGEKDDRNWFPGLAGYVLLTERSARFSPEDMPFGLIERGFVSEICLSVADFTEDHARELFSTHPIERVRLGDAEPAQAGYAIDGVHPLFRWYIQNDDYPLSNTAALPEPIYYLLKGEITEQNGSSIQPHYRSPEAALEALGAACVRYSRRLAGLKEE